VEPFDLAPTVTEVLDWYIVQDTAEPQLTIVASGSPVGFAREAVGVLSREGVNCRLINVINQHALGADFARAVAASRPVLCVYNGHPEILAGSVALALVRAGVSPGSFTSVGFSHGQTGLIKELYAHYGIDAASIIQRCRDLVAKPKEEPDAVAGGIGHEESSETP
jgi:transketolase C-terminal domain/subunit